MSVIISSISFHALMKTLGQPLPLPALVFIKVLRKEMAVCIFCLSVIFLINAKEATAWIPAHHREPQKRSSAAQEEREQMEL